MQQSKFFDAKVLAPGTTRITGLGMEHCYLLEGADKALLVDTLTGCGDLRAFCRELTDLPIYVVNTHYHFDHRGGNPLFDICYIHPDDIAALYENTGMDFQTPMDYITLQIGGTGKSVVVKESDFQQPRPTRLYPVYDGDIFELGDRQLEVIGVPGHSRGSIVLLDRALRAVFSGDACNSNTIMVLPTSTSIEEYLESLEHFNRFSDLFDILYGGHGESLPARVVAEGISLCREIMDGRDDAFEKPFMGVDCLYAKKCREGFGRDDGKIANIAYARDKIRKPKLSRIVQMPVREEALIEN